MFPVPLGPWNAGYRYVIPVLRADVRHASRTTREHEVRVRCRSPCNHKETNGTSTISRTYQLWLFLRSPGEYEYEYDFSPRPPRP
eukprot:scaffold448524_cov31-Prasinocladus_malaysianus.AAC.1